MIPPSIVTGIYTRAAKGKGDGGGKFVIGNKAREANICRNRWSNSGPRPMPTRRKGEVGPIDFDPVTNSQEPDIKSFKVIAEKQEADKATIAVTIEGHQGRGRKPADQTVRYHFVREDGQWKIDDIKGTATEAMVGPQHPCRFAEIIGLATGPPAAEDRRAIANGTTADDWRVPDRSGASPARAEARRGGRRFRRARRARSGASHRRNSRR